MSSDEPQPAEAPPPMRRRRRRRRGSHSTDAQHPWTRVAKVFAIAGGVALLFLTGRSVWRYAAYVKGVREQTREERAKAKAEGVDASKIKLERLPSTEAQMALEALRTGTPMPGGTHPAPTTTQDTGAGNNLSAPATEPAPTVVPPAPAPAAHGESTSAVTGPLSKALPLQILPLDAEDAEAREALQNLRSCESAAHWRDLLPLIREPERCEPLMRLYYEARKGANPPVVRDLICSKTKIGSTDAIIIFPVGTRTANSAAKAIYVRSPDGKWVLDWESWVGHSETSWEEFRARRTITPTLFRIVATAGSYFNYEFTEEKRYLSVETRSPDEKHVIHAFCERESPLGQALTLLITGNAPVGAAGGPGAPVRAGREQRAAITLRLAFPPSAQSDNCVIITDLVSGTWLVQESDK